MEERDGSDVGRMGDGSGTRLGPASEGQFAMSECHRLNTSETYVRYKPKPGNVFTSPVSGIETTSKRESAIEDSIVRLERIPPARLVVNHVSP